MRCDDVRDELLDGAAARSSAAAAHLTGCPSCTGFARRIGQLDDRLRAALVVEPPAELQTQLLALAHAAARPSAVPVAVAVPSPVPAAAAPLGWLRDLSTWVAALTLALAGWQLYAWLEASTLVLGDVLGAARLVVGSPTVGLAVDFGVDPLSLALWAGVAVVTFLVAQSRDALSRPDAA
jgi:hypothetical protein